MCAALGKLGVVKADENCKTSAGMAASPIWTCQVTLNPAERPSTAQRDTICSSMCGVWLDWLLRSHWRKGKRLWTAMPFQGRGAQFQAEIHGLLALNLASTQPHHCLYQFFWAQEGDVRCSQTHRHCATC